MSALHDDLFRWHFRLAEVEGYGNPPFFVIEPSPAETLRRLDLDGPRGMWSAAGEQIGDLANIGTGASEPEGDNIGRLKR